MIASVFTDHGVTGWQAILGLAVMALYGQLCLWNWTSDKRAQKNIEKMELIVESQNTKIELAKNEAGTAKIEAAKANVEAKMAKHAAQQPCHLPECPKRGLKTFSVDQVAGSE
jgi:hypothetical protein